MSASSRALSYACMLAAATPAKRAKRSPARRDASSKAPASWAYTFNPAASVSGVPSGSDSELRLPAWTA